MNPRNPVSTFLTLGPQAWSGPLVCPASLFDMGFEGSNPGPQVYAANISLIESPSLLFKEMEMWFKNKSYFVHFFH